MTTQDLIAELQKPENAGKPVVIVDQSTRAEYDIEFTDTVSHDFKLIARVACDRQHQESDEPCNCDCHFCVEHCEYS